MKLTKERRKELEKEKNELAKQLTDVGLSDEEFKSLVMRLKAIDAILAKKGVGFTVKNLIPFLGTAVLVFGTMAYEQRHVLPNFVKGFVGKMKV